MLHVHLEVYWCGRTLGPRATPESRSLSSVHRGALDAVRGGRLWPRDVPAVSAKRTSSRGLRGVAPCRSLWVHGGMPVPATSSAPRTLTIWCTSTCLWFLPLPICKSFSTATTIVTVSTVRIIAFVCPCSLLPWGGGLENLRPSWGHGSAGMYDSGGPRCGCCHCGRGGWKVLAGWWR